VSGQGKGHAAPPTAARLEDRLLRSPLGPVYRLAVAAAARALLAYVTHAPSWAPRHIVWERIGYRFVFPRGYVMVARTAFGAAITCSMKDLIQRHILFFGVWEPNLTEFLRRRLMPGDTFIELGANVGYFTLLASQRVGENGAVVAVEAAPDIFRQLQDNLARNAARNVRAVPIAVAAAAGTVRLFADHRGNLGATTTIPTPGFTEAALVPAAPFEQVVTPRELAGARVIKIDIEGAELPPLLALLTLAPTLRQDVEIVVELSPDLLRRAGSGADEIVAAFARLGFHAYDLQNSYAIGGYFSRRPATAPRRIRGPIVEQTDVVFSRRDQDVL